MHLLSLVCTFFIFSVRKNLYLFLGILNYLYILIEHYYHLLILCEMSHGYLENFFVFISAQHFLNVVLYDFTAHQIQ